MKKEDLYFEFIMMKKTRKQISQEYNLSLNQIQYLLTKYHLLKDINKSNKVKQTKQKKFNKSIIITNKDLLYQEFITNNKTRKQIALENNVSEALIKKQLRLYSIKKPSSLYHVNTVNACKDKQTSIKSKREQTMKKRYGVINYTTHPDFLKKARLSLDKHHTWTVSKAEDQIHQLLVQKFLNVKRQYRSEKYPFNCDFYIPEKDLYIEYQGTWLHGSKPYDSKDKDCIQLISEWKNKNTVYYMHAIEVYTLRDTVKRQTAKENNLNWIEFFDIKDFMEWYNEQ